MLAAKGMFACPLQRSQADKTVERPIGAKENAIILK